MGKVAALPVHQARRLGPILQVFFSFTLFPFFPMLHVFRGTAFAKTLSVSLLTSFLTVSCSKDKQATVAPAVQAAAADYTGEELFKGIFLLEGEVTTKIPYLQAFRSAVDKQKVANPEQAQQRQAQVEVLVNKVRKLNPAYYGELKAAIKSQNFDRIEATLKSGASLIEAASLASFTTQEDKDEFLQKQQAVKSIDASKYDFTKSQDVEKYIADAKAASKDATPNSRQAPDALDVVNVTDIALFLYFAASVAVVVVLVIVAAKGPDVDSATQLEKEQFVQQLAFNLD